MFKNELKENFTSEYIIVSWVSLNGTIMQSLYAHITQELTIYIKSALRKKVSNARTATAGHSWKKDTRGLIGILAPAALQATYARVRHSS